MLMAAGAYEGGGVKVLGPHCADEPADETLPGEPPAGPGDGQ